MNQLTKATLFYAADVASSVVTPLTWKRMKQTKKQGQTTWG